MHVGIAVAIAISFGAPAQSKVHRDEQQGFEIKSPSSWKLAAQDGRVMMGSDTEAGLMMAWFDPASTWELMSSYARAGINEGGVSLVPRGEPREIKTAAGHRALSVELGGT